MIKVQLDKTNFKQPAGDCLANFRHQHLFVTDWVVCFYFYQLFLPTDDVIDQSSVELS